LCKLRFKVNKMSELELYTNDILGQSLGTTPLAKEAQNQLPLYMTETYELFMATLYGSPLTLAKLRQGNFLSTSQIEKHVDLLESKFHRHAVLVAREMSAINRKRLVEKKINFIVPFKQFYIPGMLIDLQQNFRQDRKQSNNEALLPSAQYIVLYQLLNTNKQNSIEGIPFKEIATKTGYTQMGITKAIENLKAYDLCRVEGKKEKSVHFFANKNELWQRALPKMTSPVIKKVYVDDLPAASLLLSGESALPAYSDMNPSAQSYYAIEKTIFYGLQKSGSLKNLNQTEGGVCIELWKYDPEILANAVGERRNVDPLSLYLSLKDSHDERIEMALEQIMEKYTW
jgi:hypothetical protein